MKRWIAVALTLFTSSCYPAQYTQEGVDEIYPPDCIRLDILEARGQPLKTHPVSDRHLDGFANSAIRDIEASSGAVVAYWDYYMTLRNWFGLWGDYLFYTKDDVLITARRRFLD